MATKTCIYMLSVSVATSSGRLRRCGAAQQPAGSGAAGCKQGLVVELDDGLMGLLHISQVSHARIRVLLDIIFRGERIKVHLAYSAAAAAIKLQASPILTTSVGIEF